MTQEQKDEFQAIIDKYETADQPTTWQFSLNEVMTFMGVAHNAAVRKCAETAEAVNNTNRNKEIYKESILRNLIP